MNNKKEGLDPREIEVQKDRREPTPRLRQGSNLTPKKKKRKKR